MFKALVYLTAFLALGLAQSTTGSLRKDLQTVGVLVSMSAPRPVQIEGLKASYAYTFTVTDANRKFPGQSTYSLVLGAADDVLFPPVFAQASASLHGVRAEIVPRMAHAMMLDTRWRDAADRIA
ncbi:MAG: hypothetical protein N2318_04060, partial [Meiothermus sp.]|nr:hypothetical protein [Meiothermus sp.]